MSCWKRRVDVPNLGDLTHRLRELNARAKALEEQIVAIDNEPVPAFDLDERELASVTELLASTVRETTDPKRLRQLMGSFIERDHAQSGRPASRVST